MQYRFTSQKLNQKKQKNTLQAVLSAEVLCEGGSD